MAGSIHNSKTPSTPVRSGVGRFGKCASLCFANVKAGVAPHKAATVIYQWSHKTLTCKEKRATRHVRSLDGQGIMGRRQPKGVRVGPLADASTYTVTRDAQSRSMVHIQRAGAGIFRAHTAAHATARHHVPVEECGPSAVRVSASLRMSATRDVLSMRTWTALNSSCPSPSACLTFLLNSLRSSPSSLRSALYVPHSSGGHCVRCTVQKIIESEPIWASVGTIKTSADAGCVRNFYGGPAFYLSAFFWHKHTHNPPPPPPLPPAETHLGRPPQDHLRDLAHVDELDSTRHNQHKIPPRNRTTKIGKRGEGAYTMCSRLGVGCLGNKQLGIRSGNRAEVGSSPLFALLPPRPLY